MAEIKKFKTSAAVAVFRHANRTPNDGHSHSNENIDLERTKFNYNIKQGNVKEWRERLKNLFCLKRENTVTLAEAVVTLPKDVQSDDERDFFQFCYEFFCDDFGDENVIYAIVHKDEVTPHMHLGFIPVVQGALESTKAGVPEAIEKWKKQHNGEVPYERVCAKEAITRGYLKKMHERLQACIDENLGYHVSILNGATIHGNKTVLELKVKTLQEKEERLKNSINNIQKDLETVRNFLSQIGIAAEKFELYPLLSEIDSLKKQNKVLMDIIVRNGFSYKPAEIKSLTDDSAIKTSALKVYEGSLVKERLPDDAVIVIELPNGKESPQQELIDSDFDLRQIVSFASRSSENVTVKKSRTSSRMFVLIKTDDNERNTINNLIEMEVLLKKEDKVRERKIYMDRIESDRYDLAKAILKANDFSAAYFEQKSYLDKYAQESEEQKEQNAKERK